MISFTKEIALAPADRHKPMQMMMREEAIKTFEKWTAKADKTEY